MANGLSLSDEQPEIAWESGRCAVAVSNGGLCPWMLLAWAQGLQELHDSQDQHGVLDGEVGAKSSARPGGLAEAGGEGMERYRHLGMRVKEGCT